MMAEVVAVLGVGASALTVTDAITSCCRRIKRLVKAMKYARTELWYFLNQLETLSCLYTETKKLLESDHTRSKSKKTVDKTRSLLDRMSKDAARDVKAFLGSFSNLRNDSNQMKQWYTRYQWGRQKDKVNGLLKKVGFCAKNITRLASVKKMQKLLEDNAELRAEICALKEKGHDCKRFDNFLARQEQKFEELRIDFQKQTKEFNNFMKEITRDRQEQIAGGSVVVDMPEMKLAEEFASTIVQPLVERNASELGLEVLQSNRSQRRHLRRSHGVDAAGTSVFSVDEPRHTYVSQSPRISTSDQYIPSSPQHQSHQSEHRISRTASKTSRASTPSANKLPLPPSPSVRSRESSTRGSLSSNRRGEISAPQSTKHSFIVSASRTPLPLSPSVRSGESTTCRIVPSHEGYEDVRTHEEGIARRDGFIYRPWMAGVEAKEESEAAIRTTESVLAEKLENANVEVVENPAQIDTQEESEAIHQSSEHTRFELETSLNRDSNIAPTELEHESPGTRDTCIGPGEVVDTSEAEVKVEASPLTNFEYDEHKRDITRKSDQYIEDQYGEKRKATRERQDNGDQSGMSRGPQAGAQAQHSRRLERGIHLGRVDANGGSSSNGSTRSYYSGSQSP